MNKIMNHSNIIFPAHFSEEAKCLIQKLLHENPNERPSIIEILDSGWVRKYMNLQGIKPKEKYSLDDVKSKENVRTNKSRPCGRISKMLLENENELKIIHMNTHSEMHSGDSNDDCDISDSSNENEDCEINNEDTRGIFPIFINHRSQNKNDKISNNWYKSL